jgi:hypothetical protein
MADSDLLDFPGSAREQRLVARARRRAARARRREIEERRYSGGSVVIRKGETVDAWTGVIDGWSR